MKTKKSPYKCILVSLDGATDVEIPELGYKTPFEAANIPTLDQIAREGICGVLYPIGRYNIPGSDTAHLAILGYDPFAVYTGRGPLEVAGVGVDLLPGDVSIRCNYVTIDDNFKLLSRTAGYPRKGTEALEEALNQITLSDPEITVTFRNSQDYRCVLHFRGPNINADISDPDPSYNVIIDDSDDITSLAPGEMKIVTAKPLTGVPEASHMAELLNEYILKAHEVLDPLPFNEERRAQGLPVVNGIMPRGAGVTPALSNFEEKWGIKGGCVSGTGLIKGICRLAGMAVANVPGATGYVDTNYEAKAEAALQLLDEGCEFVLVHVEGIDEVAHDRDYQGKIKAIEDSSERLIKTLVDAADEHLVLCII
ncbi:MAG TPA: 2,3-bisphosphoglycerate-independent phosphoglycerate mutase, partial [Candidatus Lokiarchaeia archaeon]|nr:2,3-bisphosphoglycerate-independent phosphoglycerate mutase [Candidatus Lokiarchaeia archaeon]